MKQKGRIITNGVILREHEQATVILLTELGYDVELILKSNVEGVHSPDIKMVGILWEMKSPIGKGKWLIKNTVQRAMHQSENVIIDLRRIKIPQEKCLRELEKQFRLAKRLKRLKVIKKGKKVVDFEK